MRHVPTMDIPVTRVLFAAWIFVCAAAAAAWPQWRGPFHDGSTVESNLPSCWSETSNVAWKTAMPGPGASTPVVCGGRVFLTTLVMQPGTNKWTDVAGVCADARTGAILWQKTLGPDRTRQGYNAACNSPVTDGTTVWFFTGTGNLSAWDYAGTQRWARALEKEHGLFMVKFGYHVSPLLYRGTLYIVVFQNKTPGRYDKSDTRHGELESFILALDAATGTTAWRHVRQSDATDESMEAYITPVPFEHEGRREVVVMGGEVVVPAPGAPKAGRP